MGLTAGMAPFRSICTVGLSCTIGTRRSGGGLPSRSTTYGWAAPCHATQASSALAPF